MIGTLARRLDRLEQAAGITGPGTPFILVSFRSADCERPDSKVTINGVVWHRAPDESPDAFLDRVRAEAEPSGPRCGIVGFLE